MDAQRHSAGSRGLREDGHHVRGRRRHGALRVLVASCVALVTCTVVVAGGAGSRGSVAEAAAAPSCNVKGAFFGLLVANAVGGGSVNIACKNFPANHPYLLVEASLLVAIDPAAAPLLTGQATSLPGLLGIIAATPELNALSVALPTSNSSGVLDTTYTIPKSQPPGPDASCPPTTEEINSGLIGCAVAMIDLESFKPVVAGTFVLEWKGDPLLPPDPTLSLSPTITKTGQRVQVRDAPGTKTYWWLATLASIVNGLGGGGGGSGPIPVVIKNGRKKLVTTAAVTPASFNGTTFTPPVLSGYFLAPAKGKHNIKATLTATLLPGLSFSVQAFAKMKVIP